MEPGLRSSGSNIHLGLTINNNGGARQSTKSYNTHKAKKLKIIGITMGKKNNKQSTVGEISDSPNKDAETSSYKSSIENDQENNGMNDPIMTIQLEDDDDIAYF